MTTKTRATIQTLDLQKKWKIIEEYLQCKLSDEDIGEKYQVSTSTVRKTIRDTYKEFQTIIETKALLSSQKSPEKLKYLTESIKSDKINEAFLALLSAENDSVLTDNEYLYAEFVTSHGDEQRSVIDSGLAVGLNSNTPGPYQDAIRIRSFYLKRKSNVAACIRELQKEKLTVMTEGKKNLQSELLALVERLKNHPDIKVLPSLLKSIELLGKTEGIFEEKHTIQNINSDDALDRLLSKVRETKEESYTN